MLRITPIRITTACVLAFALGCDGAAGGEDSGTDDSGTDDSGTGTDSDDPGESAECIEDTLWTPPNQPPLNLDCVSAGPCDPIMQLWTFNTETFWFDVSAAGSEAAVACWYEQLALGTPGTYVIQNDINDEVSTGTWYVHTGGFVEWIQYHEAEDGSSYHGYRNLVDAATWIACAGEWDGGETLPDCFYEPFLECTVWASAAEVCG